MSILAQLAIAALLFVAGAAAGIRWHAGEDAIRENGRMESQRLQHARDEKRVDTAAGSLERDRREIETHFLTITETVHETIQGDFYAGGAPACLDDAGLRDLAAAIDGPAAAASQPARAVPAAAASAQR